MYTSSDGETDKSNHEHHNEDDKNPKLDSDSQTKDSEGKKDGK